MAAVADAALPSPQNSDALGDVLKILAEDLPAADLQWSLFVAALRSYRYDTVLRPFPADFVDRSCDTKHIDELREVAAGVPALATLLLDEPNRAPPESWQLLRWVLTSGGVRLRSRRQDRTVPELRGSQVDLVFEVEHSAQTERRFASARGERDVFFAYHGSRLDNFYSILHNGLLAHMNKNSLFGAGTYLSSELSVSSTFSPAGFGWQHSVVSSEFSLVAMCELIDHPDVKCQDRSKSQPSRAYAQDSIGGKVPEKYFLVQNNSVVRVRYLLVYTAVHPRSPSPEILPAGRPAETCCAFSWPEFLRKNKSWFMIAAYAALLCGIGLSSSRVGHKIMLKFFYR
uniref:Poly [ADP-ribose] polymerase n=1 Tax=Ixodes ricinus TaxID=34613 RepID=V5HDU1_IXORI